jgi:hypothetical protein
MISSMELLLNKLNDFGLFEKPGIRIEFREDDLELVTSEDTANPIVSLYRRTTKVSGSRMFLGSISKSGEVHTQRPDWRTADFESIMPFVVARMLLQAQGDVTEYPRSIFPNTPPIPESVEPYLVDVEIGDVSHAWVLWYAKKHNVDNDYAWYQGMLKLIELNDKLTGFIGRSFASNIRHLSKPKERK